MKFCITLQDLRVATAEYLERNQGKTPFLCRVILGLVGESEESHRVDVIQVLRHEFPDVVCGHGTMSVLEYYVAYGKWNIFNTAWRLDLLDHLIVQHGGDYGLEFTVTPNGDAQ